MVLEFDFFDKIVKRAEIFDVYAYERLDSSFGFEVDKELVFYVLMKEVDKVDARGEFRVMFFGKINLLVSRVERFRLAA